MLVAQLLPFSKNLAARKWTDEDIVEDIQYLRDELSARFESMTWVKLVFVCVVCANQAVAGRTTSTAPN